MKDYKKLRVWKKAHELVLMIYETTKNFPVEEKYGITSQIRRSGVSIPTNIAEGSGKYTQIDFARYLQISLGSTQEVDYLNFLATDLKFQEKETGDQIERATNEVRSMLINLILTVRKNA
jgi:four helix bundle protein